MKQFKIIKDTNKLFKSFENIQSCILIGSFGRGIANPNSDIDYQLLVDNFFNHEKFILFLKEQFKEALKYYLYIESENKYFFYFYENYIKLEIFICYELKHLDKYYLGSEIREIEKSMIFDKTNQVKLHLEKITNDKNIQKEQLLKEKITALITKFQHYFEKASSCHAKGDGYKFNVLFNGTLNSLVRIIYLCEGKTEHEYMPPNFLNQYSRPKNLKIESLKDIMYLRDANKNKIFLLDLFKKYLPIAISKFELTINSKEVFSFLDEILERDYFWNFRDASKFNSKLKRNLLYRTSKLTNYQNDSYFDKLLNEKNIKNIIDLREEKELKENFYQDKSLEKFNYVHVPFEAEEKCSGYLLKYNYHLKKNKYYIKKVIENILKNNGATVIHCTYGKDRTGIIFTLFHLLVGATKKEIENDYLASEMDTDIKLLDVIFENVEEQGGIIKYLKSCDLSEEQIYSLRKKIFNG